MMARILAIFGLLVSFAGPAAANDNVFVVPRVLVQAQADTAESAKSAAQSDGRRRAVDRLLRRLTVEEDWVYLPKLASGLPAEASRGGQQIALSDRQLELLESGFEVYDEKTSSRTYRAFITYRFKPAAIRKLLRDARIPYSEAQTRAALVVPVLQTANGAYLWESNNPWLAAWKIRSYDNELTPMVAPRGDAEDQGLITAQQALALNQGAIEALAQRYSVAQVIIAHAYLRQEDGEDRLRVRFLNGLRESGVVSADQEGVGTQADFSREPLSIDAPTQIGEVLAETYLSRQSGNFPVLAEEAIELTLAKNAKTWKRNTLIDHSEASLLEASAYFRSIDEWAKIRAALVSTPLVGSIQIRALSRRGAEMTIRAFGDPGKLIVAMEAQGLALWTDDNETWIIATPATAQDVRRQSRRRNRFGEVIDNEETIFPASVSEDDAAATVETRY